MTLETAKALKEAGWDKETENCYYDEVNNDPETVQKGNYEFANTFKNHRPIYPCPSLEELLAVMPKNICLQKCRVDITIVYRAYSEAHKIYILHENPTEAVAQLWLKLRKEGIV